MSVLIQNFLRRIEKIWSGRPTLPVPGTNHVDDTWIPSDIYPGELSLDLDQSIFYTSDGNSILTPNVENSIVTGLVLSKPTSGTDKVAVSDGQAVIRGRNYFFTSSGTDLLISPNAGSTYLMYFVYGIESQTVFVGEGASAGNYTLALDYVGVTGNSSGDFGIVANVENNVVSIPSNSILLGAILYPPTSSGINLFPTSVVQALNGGAISRLSPSDFVRQRSKERGIYGTNILYFEGQEIRDPETQISYIALTTFVSAGDIPTDIGLGNINVVNKAYSDSHVAGVDLNATISGSAPWPKMGTSQRLSISSPSEGDSVYDLNLHMLYVWDGSAWQAAW